MQIISIILIWSAIWLISWSIWIFLLVKKDINYINAPLKTIFYFLALSIITFTLYYNNLYTFFSNLPLKLFPVYFVVIYTLLTIGIYYFSKKIFGKKLLTSHYKKRVFTGMMDYRFLIAKSFDISFQQLFFLCLILSIKKTTSSFWIIVLISGIIFGLVHIPLLKTKHNILSTYFVIFSFFAGFIFAFLMLFLPFGFIYSYFLHWSFYIIIGVIFNIKAIQQNKSFII